MADINSIYSNVYNYYHQTIAPRPGSRFDSHKKADLKDIYNSIVGISKEEPVYLFAPTSAIEQYTISMKESAMQFSRDITSMGGMDAHSLFEQKSLSSSDEELATVSYLPEAPVASDSPDIKITIESLAKPQINNGRYLSSDQLDIEPGAYSFDVATSGSNYELQFNIGENDTNLSIQTRLARLINNAAIGMSATVSYDGNGNSALNIASTSTGPDAYGTPPFTISDEETSQQKGIVDYLGIRDADQQASWAHCIVNGNDMYSPENKIQIDGMYSVELKGVNQPGSEPVTITTKADYESLREHILGVAGSYNQFIKTAAEFLDRQPRTSVLIDTMKRMNSFYSSTMDKLGIKRNSDGTLDVDEEHLDEALRENATSDDISSLKSFTQSALKKISRVQLNPMDYVDKRIVAYKNPNRTHFANPYMTSAYSGMLFNSYM